MSWRYAKVLVLSLFLHTATDCLTLSRGRLKDEKESRDFGPEDN